MIEECNFRNHGIYGLEEIPEEIPEDMPKMYCSIRTHDALISKDGKTVDGSTKVNSLCDGEDNCVLFQLYKNSVRRKATRQLSKI